MASAQTGNNRGLGVSILPNQSKRFALVIGVDQYKDINIAALKAGVNDAKTIADALVKYAGFPQENVYLLTTNQPENSQPTRGVIMERLEMLARQIPSDGLLLFSFAGHGIEREGKPYLLPSDAKATGSIRLLEDTSLSVAVLKEMIKATNAKQVIMILDACRNDPLASRSAGNNLMPVSLAREFNFDIRNQEVEAFATLYATKVGSRSYESALKQQGYFSYAIVQGLAGKAANERGEITLNGLLRFVEETVPKLVVQETGANSQIPYSIVEGYKATDLIISYAPKAALPDPSSPTLVNAELQDWQKVKNSQDPKIFLEFLRRYPAGDFADAAEGRLATLLNKKEPEPPPSDGLPERTRSHPAISSNRTATLATIENPELINRRKINDGQRNVYGFDNEFDLGKRMAAEINSQSKFIEDTFVVEYIDWISQNIVLHSDARIPFTIRVLDTDNINAFVFGGFLYVSRGLITAANNEAQLAGAIAHQVAHVAARHGTEQDPKGQLMKYGVSSLSSSVLLWNGYAIRPAAARGIPLNLISFSPVLEQEADMLAAQYLWASYYDPTGLLAFSETVHDQKKKGLSSIDEIFTPHLLTTDRVNSVRALLDRLPYRPEYDLDRLNFRRVKSRLAAMTKAK